MYKLTDTYRSKLPGSKTLIMENQAKDNIELLLDKGSDYLSTRIDLYKLKVVDTSSDVLSAVISKGIVFTVFAVFFLIANIGIALLLGELLGKLYYGFFIVAGFYLIMLKFPFLQLPKWQKSSELMFGSKFEPMLI